MNTNLVLLLIILIHITNIFAQWQPDQRLTNNTASSNTSNNNARCVAASENEVHVVWYDDRNPGNSEIYYKRSTDGGINWGADVRLTNSSDFSGYPSISVSGLVIHVVWEDSRNGNSEIYYKRSTDSGINWGIDTRLTSNTASSTIPSISVSGSAVYVVWRDDRSDQFGDIFYKRSTDGGVSWGSDLSLTISNNSYSAYPSISISGTFIHVVWHDSRDGNSEIYYKRSTDNGITWGSDTRLTNNISSSTFPNVSVAGSLVHIVWNDDRIGNSNRIYFKRSSDGGISWGSDTRLTTNNAYEEHPSVSISGSAIHAIWMDQRNGPLEVYYKRSLNEGITWESDIRLTISAVNSNLPSVAFSGSFVHVVWQDQRDGNFEVYYKRNPTGNLVGLIHTNFEIPNSFSLLQNFPNPFNPVTNIEFTLPKQGSVELIIYNSLGKQVAVLVNGNLNAGRYSADWDATHYPSGVYFYTLKAESYTETKKMILIK